MTGQGRAEQRSDGWIAQAEVRSLNNRFWDLNLRVSSVLRSREAEVRNLLAEQLQRGKVDAVLLLTSAKQTGSRIHLEAVMAYYEQLRPLIKKWKAKKPDLLPTLLHLPDVLQSSSETLDDRQWALVQRTLLQAIEQVHFYRREEGKKLETALRSHTEKILQQLDAIEPLEEQRRNLVRSRLLQQLEQWRSDAGFDPTRLEQELIYYMERMDFTEEKVRLKAHCTFFLQTLSEPISNGRRLSFIAQEMGREVNTLGAKAYQSEIQKYVVFMKEEVEKIKEQLQNVL